MTLHAAILAGGSGTRFWPAGTRAVPKQMLPLVGGVPMLRAAFDRLAGLVPPERTAVVTSEAGVAAVAALLPELPPGHVLGEPAARNTAAACALASRWALGRDPQATLVVVPADHSVAPAEALRAALAAAAGRAADAGTLVTLGLTPRSAATGYGWIRLGERIEVRDGHAVHRVDRFVEKPDRARAEAFLAEGGHLWNLGMFAWRAGAFLEALAEHLPEVARAFADAQALDPESLRGAYAACPSISVDHGVLERAARVECVPASFEWDDLGSFAALGRHLPRDARGNAAVGRLLALDADDCISWSEDGRLNALLGVRDLIVVQAHGVTLVAPRSRAEEVRRLVERLPEAGLEEFA